MKLTADSMTDDFKQALRGIMHEVIQQEVPGIVQGIVYGTVRTELQDVRDDIRLLKEVQGTQSLQLRRIESTMSSLSATVRSHSGELHRLNVLLEDLYDRFSAARELRWD